MRMASSATGPFGLLRDVPASKLGRRLLQGYSYPQPSARSRSRRL